MQYPQPITKLIESLSKLPGIGNKTAERLAFYVISSMKEDDVTTFAKALIDSKRQLFKCPICGHITDTDPCSICSDSHRDRSLIAVVQDPKDVAIERMRGFKGLYHVLNGVLSPLDGMGPEDIGIPALIERLKDENVKELILRIKAVFRKIDKGDVIKIKDEVEINTLSYEVKIRGHEVNLTNTEYKILLLLVKNQKKIFTRDELLELVTDDHYEKFDRIIDAHIKNLRQKIEEDTRKPKIIQTVYGVGYKLGI